MPTGTKNKKTPKSRTTPTPDPSPDPSPQPANMTGPEIEIRSAVANWLKVESENDRRGYVAKFHLAKAVFEAKELQILDGDIRTYVISSIEDIFGPGSSKLKTRKEDISRILTVGLKGTSDHWSKWSKQNTPFRAAYDEVSQTQVHPASSRNGEEAPNSPVEESRSWTSPIDPGTPEDPPEGSTERSRGTPAASSKAKDAGEAPNPTQHWANQIDRKADLWPRLIQELMNMGPSGVLTPAMLVEAIELVEAKSDIKARNFVELLLQKSETLHRHARSFIEDNPNLW
jgi:hypothetical protein